MERKYSTMAMAIMKQGDRSMACLVCLCVCVCVCVCVCLITAVYVTKNSKLRILKI